MRNWLRGLTYERFCKSIRGIVIFCGAGLIFAALAAPESFQTSQGRWGAVIGGIFLIALVVFRSIRLILAAGGCGLVFVAGVYALISGQLIQEDVGTTIITILIYLAFGGGCVYALHEMGVASHGIRSARRVELAGVDKMSGIDFENYCIAILQLIGYTNVHGTAASGDQGVDIVAEKDGIKYAIQCKRYTSKLDNTPVQEVFAGKQYYGCDVAVVLTNNYFTDGAQDLAGKTGVRLWNRTDLNRMIEQAFPPATPAPKKELSVVKKLKEKMQERNKVDP